ncbi:hypothetical protein B0O95_10430 [Mycetohabitans endofungorum]|uniref:Uncharacterized protein n=1 Tax=Mycetohabitans endofungorum TaxID=417203 RepID=A0A2P5KBJ4_9BURK|nr:hypothetical protein B0O95_10430 [Mycetohabitans endofungorum]
MEQGRQTVVHRHRNDSNHAYDRGARHKIPRRTHRNPIVAIPALPGQVPIFAPSCLRRHTSYRAHPDRRETSTRVAPPAFRHAGTVADLAG